jgi:hypothetical protein
MAGHPKPLRLRLSLEAVLAETSAKKHTWVFDELSGGFFGDGAKHSLVGINDLKFILGQGDGVASQDDKGSDWVILKRRK